jgi:hypothetical protein
MVRRVPGGVPYRPPGAKSQKSQKAAGTFARQVPGTAGHRGQLRCHAPQTSPGAMHLANVLAGGRGSTRAATPRLRLGGNRPLGLANIPGASQVPCTL